MPIYFNHNSTHPVLPEAIEAWTEAAKIYWKNPSALDAGGVLAHTKLEEARSQVANFCQTEASSIVFTSGATENAHSVFSYWSRNSTAECKVGVSVLEHPCVYQAAQHYFPGRTVPLRITPEGTLDCDYLSEILEKEKIRGVAVLAASHLIGTLQPIPTIAALCHTHGASLFVDAAQWAGRLPIDPLQEADWLGMSSHKLGGPRGVGALKIPSGINEPLLFAGGHQQNDLRAGTEDVPGILGFVKAWEATSRKTPAQDRGRFIELLGKVLPEFQVIAPNSPALWNTVGVIAPHTSNTRWVKRLEKKGYIVGQGSACGSNPQDLLLSESLGVSIDVWQRFLRFSGGYETQWQDWEGLAHALKSLDMEFTQAPPLNGL